MTDRAHDPRIDMMVDDMREMKQGIGQIVVVLQRLASLEEKYQSHSALMLSMIEKNDKMDERVRALEQVAPITKLVSKWVIGGVVFVVSAVGAALTALVVRHA